MVFHDVVFFVKKKGVDAYCLWMMGSTQRMRWGTADQIREDLEYARENGVMPPVQMRW